MVRIKRVYDEPSEEDGFRILIDGLWPRGLTREKANVEVWLRKIAPSADLRTWFGHDPSRWSGFKLRYFEELDQNTEAMAELRSYTDVQDVTLVYAARDRDYNNAVCLAEYLTTRQG